MSKTLGGFLFIRNGREFDYCFRETIKCLTEFCDQVSVVDCGSDDGTVYDLRLMESVHYNLNVTYLDDESWNSVHGKEKLSYFQNIASSKLTTDYQFLLQADEIVHENSYDAIRRAMNDGQDGYMCNRFNLWSSPFTKLSVQQNRQPCSTEVIRLTKVGHQCYDDGENIDAQSVNNYLEQIRIYHMGFVRKREVMKSKIINMQRNVFGMADYDNKLDECDVFDSKLWFDGSDLEPIKEPLPKIIQEWAIARI